jgi:hypothetical protein
MDIFSRLNYDLQIRTLMFRPIHPIAVLIKNIIRSKLYQSVELGSFHQKVNFVKKFNKNSKKNLRCVYIKYKGEIVDYI